LENKYTSEDVLLLKKKIEEVDIMGCFIAYSGPYSLLSIINENGDYREPDTPLVVTGSGISYDTGFTVDAFKEPIYYLKYIISHASNVAISNIGQFDGKVIPSAKECVDWRDYLDIYDFVFYAKKEDIGLYINRKGLDIFVKWRLEIGK